MSAVQIVAACVCALIFIIFVILSIVANRMLNSTFVPSSPLWKKLDLGDGDCENASEEEKEVFDKVDAVKKFADRWLGNTPHEDLWIESFDGLKLHGLLFKSTGSHRYAIVVHGYRGRLRETSVYGMTYHKSNFNVLLPENRASGMSEGKFVSMGAFEKKDVVRWIEKILEIDSEAEIFLHGESLGAATVMMTLGENLPENVKGAIADCGYTSIWEEFCYLLKDCMHKPIFPLLYLSDFYSRIRFGFGFKKTSSIRAVKKSRTPLLILHGGKDKIVPTAMAKKIYVATASKKDWFIMPGADHCQSVIVDTDVYWAKVQEFLSRVM